MLSGAELPEIGAGDPSYSPTKDDVLFKVSTFLGPTYKFFLDRFEITKGSEFLEELLYTEMADCEPKIRIVGEGTVEFKIRILLKEDPPREIILPRNCYNGRLGTDLITWLNIKLAEEDAMRS